MSLYVLILLSDTLPPTILFPYFVVAPEVITYEIAIVLIFDCRLNVTMIFEGRKKKTTLGRRDFHVCSIFAQNVLEHDLFRMSLYRPPSDNILCKRKTLHCILKTVSKPNRDAQSQPQFMEEIFAHDQCRGITVPGPMG